jgi:hypothetical protein
MKDTDRAKDQPGTRPGVVETEQGEKRRPLGGESGSGADSGYGLPGVPERTSVETVPLELARWVDDGGPAW